MSLIVKVLTFGSYTIIQLQRVNVVLVVKEKEKRVKLSY